MTYSFEGQDAVISPQLVYYKDIIVDNIEKMIALAGGTERLWPHVKTHKMIEVVKMMMAQGIDRFKCATIAEAEMCGEAKASRVALAYPLVGPNIAEAYYNDGYEAYRQENFADAIPNLEKAYKYDATNGEALYNLANAYNRIGETDKARAAYLQIIQLFPGTEKASKSQTFLEEMENED